MSESLLFPEYFDSSLFESEDEGRSISCSARNASVFEYPPSPADSPTFGDGPYLRDFSDLAKKRLQSHIPKQPLDYASDTDSSEGSSSPTDSLTFGDSPYPRNFSDLAGRRLLNHSSKQLPSSTSLTSPGRDTARPCRLHSCLRPYPVLGSAFLPYQRTHLLWPSTSVANPLSPAPVDSSSPPDRPLRCLPGCLPGLPLDPPLRRPLCHLLGCFRRRPSGRTPGPPLCPPPSPPPSPPPEQPGFWWGLLLFLIQSLIIIIQLFLRVFGVGIYYAFQLIFAISLKLVDSYCYCISVTDNWTKTIRPTLTEICWLVYAVIWDWLFPQGSGARNSRVQTSHLDDSVTAGTCTCPRGNSYYVEGAKCILCDGVIIPSNGGPPYIVTLVALVALIRYPDTIMQILQRILKILLDFFWAIPLATISWYILSYSVVLFVLSTLMNVMLNGLPVGHHDGCEFEPFWEESRNAETDSQ